MVIKKFNEMVSDNILDTVRDILDSNILDISDLELDRFGWGIENTYQLLNSYGRYRPAKQYQYELPDGEIINLDGSGESYDLEIDLSIYGMEDQIEFLMIELRCLNSYLQQNIDILDDIKSSLKMIRSMGGFDFAILMDEYFKNSISFSEYWSVKHLDWDNPNKEEIIDFLKLGPKNDNLRLQIFLTELG